MKYLPLVLLWAAQGITVLCTLLVVSYAALVLFDDPVRQSRIFVNNAMTVATLICERELKP